MMPALRPVTPPPQPETGYRREKELHAEMLRAARGPGWAARLAAALRGLLRRTRNPAPAPATSGAGPCGNVRVAPEFPADVGQTPHSRHAPGSS